MNGRTRSLLALAVLSLAAAIAFAVRAYTASGFPYGVAFFAAMAVGFAWQARKEHMAFLAAERARDAAWRIAADRRLDLAGEEARAAIARFFADNRAAAIREADAINVGEVSHHPERGTR